MTRRKRYETRRLGTRGGERRLIHTNEPRGPERIDMSDGPRFSVTQCLNIAAACESYLDTAVSHEEKKGDTTELKKRADEAREQEAEAVKAAKEDHGDGWPADVCEHIADLNGQANQAHTEHELAKRERDKLSKQRAQLLERWTLVTTQAIEGGDLYGPGLRSGVKKGEQWRDVHLANICGDLLAENFSNADPQINTVGEFCDVGRSQDFGRLIEEGAIPPSVARDVADQVLAHLRRNSKARAYPKQIDDLIAGYMAKPEPDVDERAAELEAAGAA